MVLTYEDPVIMSAMRDALRPFLNEGEMLIYRNPFRWHDDKDESVLPNHYEMLELPTLASNFDYEIVHDFYHLGIVKKKENADDNQS